MSDIGSCLISTASCSLAQARLMASGADAVAEHMSPVERQIVAEIITQAVEQLRTAAERLAASPKDDGKVVSLAAWRRGC
jgi:hypothetical protein